LFLWCSKISVIFLNHRRWRRLTCFSTTMSLHSSRIAEHSQFRRTKFCYSNIEFLDFLGSQRHDV
jgi:hypothetical protein